MILPTCIVKLVELCLTIACLTLHQYSYDLTDLPTLMLCSGTFICFVVILAGEMIGEMLLSPLDVVQDMFYGLVGSILYLTCAGKVLASRLLDSGHPRTGDVTSAVAMGGLAVACAVVMLLDMCVAYMDSEVYDEEGSV